MRKYCILGLLIFCGALVISIFNLYYSAYDSTTTSSIGSEQNRRDSASRAVARDAEFRRLAETGEHNLSDVSSSLNLNEYRRNFVKQARTGPWLA